MAKIDVAPLAGAWIEIVEAGMVVSSTGMSLPSRERGLKLKNHKGVIEWHMVAPLAGAWIEIPTGAYPSTWFEDCRSPRGSVD